MSADDPGFVKAMAKPARLHWRFRPPIRDGSAIESWRKMPARASR